MFGRNKNPKEISALKDRVKKLENLVDKLVDTVRPKAKFKKGDKVTASYRRIFCNQVNTSGIVCSVIFDAYLFKYVYEIVVTDPKYISEKSAILKDVEECYVKKYTSPKTKYKDTGRGK